MKFKRLATIFMAAAMMVSLVACAGDNGENSETPVTSGNDVVEETETNHITLAESWGFENFYTIMTPDVSASNFGITYYLSNFYDVLVEYQDGEYVGGLAEDWKISEDGTVYTFNLRHDVKFSDGSDLTAEDVAKSLLAVPINLGQYNGTYGRLSTIIEDAVVVDDYTVEMHLTQPYYNALRELCLANPFGIVSSEQLNDDLTKKDTFETATYGTGPYMYVGDNDGQTWNFESNPYYWGEKPDVESFSIESIPDNDAKILALKNGEIDFVAGITNVSNESFVEMQNTEGFGAKVDDKSFRTGYIGYNLSSSMFGDEVVRQAITLALDKDAISESIYGGLYEKADTFFPKTLPYCDVEQTVYSYDIDRANQLLDEAGYIDTDGDGILDKDGKPLTFNFIVYNSRAELPLYAEAVQADLKKVGIDMKIKTVDYNLIDKMGQEGDYDMLISNIVTANTGDPIWFLANYWHTNNNGSNPQNGSGYSNPQVDQLLDAAETEFDPAKRRDYAIQIQQLLMNDGAALFLGYPKTNIVTGSYLKGAVMYPSDYYWITNKITK